MAKKIKLGMLYVLVFTFITTLLISCSDPTPEPPVLTYDEAVKPVIFTESTATINFDNLERRNIYLVKVNKSEYNVSAINTGRAHGSYPSFQDNVVARNYSLNEEFPPMGHPAALEFNANPPPIVDGLAHRSRNTFVPPVVGNTRMFWVETYFDSSQWVQRQATLMATSTYSNIWVMNNGITTAQAQALANKFDLIYPITTNILGFEYGGGPGENGGVDGDPKIQILVYDIVDASGDVAAGGFFWSKDFYEQSQLGSQRTNLAEIFYVNTSTVKSALDYTYSLLVHEFQHMINFNVKYVEHRKNSAAWYNEMLSMMAEDVIAPLIGVTSTNWYHEIQQRIPLFIESYNEVGVTEWDEGNANEIGSSYAKGYAFGAYLMRNYGGADLLRRIIANDTTDIDSITSALNGISFEQALERYGEAMIFSGSRIPEGAFTFDKTVTSKINGRDYIAYRFDIWNMHRHSQNVKGPLIFDLTPIDMRPHSIILQSSSAWRNKSGNFSITLEKPNDPDIEFYLMVR